MPEPDISQFDDAQIAREIQHIANEIRIVRRIAQSAEEMLNTVARLCGIDDEFLNSPSVNGLVKAASILAPGSEGEEGTIDMILAQRLTIAAALRLSRGTIKAIDRKTDPNNDDDPNVPVEV